jgi:hypothetical protein
MALKAASLLNEQNNYHLEMYGIVSSGKIWEFGKYTPNNPFYRSDAYSIGQPELILGILEFIFSSCEKQMISATS